jgi:hypothetical protein
MAFGSTPADANNIPIGCVYVPGVGFKALQGGKIFTDASSNDSAPVAVMEVGGTKATYTYSLSATAPYATPTDWIVLRGSATKLVKVMRIEFSAAATASTAGIVFTIKKHTIANTVGTSTTPAFMQHDSSDGAGTAVILLYSVAPTIDASATVWKTVRVSTAILAQGTFAATDAPIFSWVYDFGMSSYEPLTLRGVAQECAINFAGAAIPSGGVYDYSISWTEE